MADYRFYPRYLHPRVIEALSDTPAVLIHGPRQCGKTTLARLVGEEAGYAYFTFDDPTVLAAAREDPVGFAERLPSRTVLDEVQRAPELFTSLKRAIDRDRRAGRFILTGSANVLLVPQLSDSLAGRMEILRLFPLAQCEIEGSVPRFLDELFAGTLKMPHAGRLGDGLVERILQGGYPEPQKRATWRRRRGWYRNYIETIVQRDIREFSRLSRMDAIPRLLELAAGQTARLLNVSELAAPFQLSRPTIGDYVSMLETVFLIDFVSPWHRNRLKRLIKTPKLHVGDTGLAAALLGLDTGQLLADRGLLGQLLETFVFGEIKRQASWCEREMAFFHYRDKDGYEVDLVVQQDGKHLAGVEVKAAGTVVERDFRGLRRLQQAAAKAFVAGVVLYDGEHVLPFGERMFAVPVSALWGTR
ncbi:MAG: ATP-binding protein [Nitrospirae bacterium]|nr:ATP-binding protein [Nitrospirota bacterium]